MDDLWGPPSYYQAPEDTDSFRFPYDVIEDTALNEQCCIQVLNIWISKQDTDISELEDELMELLSQLACTDVEFSEMLSMSLKAHVDFLDSAVRKLKDGAGEFSSASRPADSINDIMKSLFRSYLRKKAQQFADKPRNVSSSYQVPGVKPAGKKKQTSSSSDADQMEFADKTHNVSSSYHVPAVNLSEKKKQTSSSSNANHLEKSKRIVINTISQIRVKTEEDNSIYPCINPMVKYSAQGPFRSSLEKSNKCQKKPLITTARDALQKNTPNCKSICQKSSLETQGKLKIFESEPDDETIGPLTICVVESSQEPAEKQMQNTTRDLVLFDRESNPENHHQQPPNVSISVKKTSKRRQILTSKLMISARSSPLLLEGPVKKYERNYYTVPELRAICKERNLTGYSKFRKVELAELLGIELIEGKKKPKKEAEKKGEIARSKETGWAIAIAG